MAELVPASFADLINRLYLEPKVDAALFGLPRKKWFVPDPNGPDLSVRFHGQRAGNASGPAAGPHTQMAQNILLSYLGGGRIMELKTVQVNDRLEIGRPCIDVTNIGYNIEWSQELLVEQSLREYVAAMMLIEIFRRDETLSGNALSGKPGEYIFDLSVGYDLAGIRSEKVQTFLDGMRDASSIIDELRAQIPSQYKFARDLDFPKQLSSTVTLSTFHGCPAGEIERICEFLIAERNLHVIVKMNPPMLGKARLENLLHEQLGYRELTVNPSAYESGLQYDEAIDLVARLKSFAATHGKNFGCKFSNTLEVLNHRDFFKPDNKVQYLSGQPLHVITMTLTDIFRQDIGPSVPISFSAGVDRQNFAQSVACGFVPVTICTDLLRPGGYGRLPGYMSTLAAEMKKVGASTVEDFILDAFGQREAARQRAIAIGGSVTSVTLSAIQHASVLNTTIAADRARNDPRYRAEANRAVPKRINSHLVIFDCITCDKCIPVCPNAANFTYPTPLVDFEYRDVIIEANGATRPGDAHRFKIDKERQIANYADFCNECGNCDTFCPEYGGPFIQKPGFYSSEETYRKAAPRDGFFVWQTESGPAIRGRIKQLEHELRYDPARNAYHFMDGAVTVMMSANDHAPFAAECHHVNADQHVVSLGIYHTMRHLLSGILDRATVHQVNASTL
ncbi:MAG: glutamate synthase [Anaerolineae bacterium]|nr:glutamate synthase [Phycisphaerae bacterium]